MRNIIEQGLSRRMMISKALARFVEMEASLFLRDVWPVFCFEDGARFVDDDGVPSA